MNSISFFPAFGAVFNQLKRFFKKVQRSVYLEVNLDDLMNNVKVLRSLCDNPEIGVIAVVKAGAYGHGSVHISRHLKENAIERLAVATVDEAVYLRKHNIPGPIHIFGNTQPWELQACLDNKLIPTVCDTECIRTLFKLLTCDNAKENTEYDTSKKNMSSLPYGAVNLKVDTGMSRNGCQPHELRELVMLCEDLNIPVDGIFTHFADSWGSPDFTQKQCDKFMETVLPLKKTSMNLHIANSGCILNKIGTELDFIRPGITMYGLPPDIPDHKFKQHGLKPIAKLRGIPNLIKRLNPQRSVGYSMTYKTVDEEWIGTFPVGYADGFWRHLSSENQNPIGAIVRDKTGEKCQIVGRVSMDAITVSLPEKVDSDEVFTLITNDYDPETSACGVAGKVGTISYEVGTRWSCRLPRVYVKEGSDPMFVDALNECVY